LIQSQRSITLIERKSRIPHNFKASKGEAVVAYREPVATQKMGCHRLSRRVNKMGFKIDIYNELI
jgi:hypothetical protein